MNQSRVDKNTEVKLKLSTKQRQLQEVIASPCIGIVSSIQIWRNISVLISRKIIKLNILELMYILL